MNPYRARRATIDDLEQLLELWKAEGLPALELERCFTDFQVVQDDQGKLLAAVGITLSGHDAKIHSETFADFGLTDTLRPLLWTRLETLAKNQGLFRIWTNESAPFWKKDAGFTVPNEEAIQRWPQAFGPSPQGWVILQLREETASPETLELELARYKKAEQARIEVMLGRAKVVKTIITILALIVFVYGVILAFSLLRNSNLQH